MAKLRGLEHYPGCLSNDCPLVQVRYPPPDKWWDENDVRRYGRLIHDSKKVGGLDHYISANPPGTESDQWQKEYFMDKKSAKQILCKTTLQSIEPHAPLASCTFFFKIVHPKSRDVISVDASLLLQYKADVSDWPRVEQGIRALFDSFIVH